MDSRSESEDWNQFFGFNEGHRATHRRNGSKSRERSQRRTNDIRARTHGRKEVPKHYHRSYNTPRSSRKEQYWAYQNASMKNDRKSLMKHAAKYKYNPYAASARNTVAPSIVAPQRSGWNNFRGYSFGISRYGGNLLPNEKESRFAPKSFHLEEDIYKRLRAPMNSTFLSLLDVPLQKASSISDLIRRQGPLDTHVMTGERKKLNSSRQLKRCVCCGRKYFYCLQ